MCIRDRLMTPRSARIERNSAASALPISCAARSRITLISSSVISAIVLVALTPVRRAVWQAGDDAGLAVLGGGHAIRVLDGLGERLMVIHDVDAVGIVAVVVGDPDADGGGHASQSTRVTALVSISAVSYTHLTLPTSDL